LPVIYAGLSVEICAMEKLAHTGAILPADLQLVSLTQPDECRALRNGRTRRAAQWEAMPPGCGVDRIRHDFLRSGRALGLIVPSAIVPEARNLIVNPLHPRFADVRFASSGASCSIAGCGPAASAVPAARNQLLRRSEAAVAAPFAARAAAATSLLTIVLPIGARAMPASFRCWMAKGMPMIVRARLTADTTWPIASQMPAKMNQRMFPSRPRPPVPMSSADAAHCG
jgi:hypothetical protein